MIEAHSADTADGVAIATVVKAYAKVTRSGGTMPSFGDVIWMVSHCSKLFEDATEVAKHLAVQDLLVWFGGEDE